MEMMRDWILQIAGIIVLGSICDAIMPEGEMKKYVKLVVGLVLTFAVIKPLMNITTTDLNLGLPGTSQSKAVEYKESLQIEEQEHVLRIYREKLAEKVEAFVQNQWGIRAKAQVEVEEKESTSFGNVLSVLVEFQQQSTVNTESVRQGLSRSFGVEPENIRIVLR